MEKGIDSGLFVNDGSFMERFKQLQQEKEKGAPSDDSKPSTNSSGTLRPNPGSSKSVFDSRENDLRKATSGASSGKLAFSLKQKSKLAVARIKLGEDEDEDEGNEGNISDEGPTKRMRLGPSEASDRSLEQRVVAPLSPKDPAVKNVADKLASFVAKNGRQFEHVTRQRNPGDTPFKFLFDLGCEDYKYYEYRLTEEEKAIVQSQDSQASRSASTSTVSTTASRTSGGSQRLFHNHSDYQTPASALYDYNENTRASVTSAQAASVGRTPTYGESNAPSAADPVAMMEFYAKKAAQEERWKQPKQSKDEMPPPASLQGGSVKKGHHMGDYIPQEELEKFLSTCNDAAAQKAVREAAEKAKIQADNVGHRLLSKMGWKEGEGLGSSKSGRSDPVMAGNVKANNLGVGASQPGEVTPEDDIYEQYKKRMMLGYRYRPNPLNNPRKAYY